MRNPISSFLFCHTLHFSPSWRTRFEFLNECVPWNNFPQKEKKKILHTDKKLITVYRALCMSPVNINSMLFFPRTPASIILFCVNIEKLFSSVSEKKMSINFNFYLSSIAMKIVFVFAPISQWNWRCLWNLIRFEKIKHFNLFFIYLTQRKTFIDDNFSTHGWIWDIQHTFSINLSLQIFYFKYIRDDKKLRRKS